MSDEPVVRKYVFSVGEPITTYAVAMVFRKKGVLTSLDDLFLFVNSVAFSVSGKNPLTAAEVLARAEPMARQGWNPEHGSQEDYLLFLHSICRIETR